MTSVANYALERLRQLGVNDLIGLPGTSCSALFDAAVAGGWKTIVTSNELEAGYAADAYARLKGMSAVSVSYGVGTLSMANAVAGAYVERSPVVVLNGGPGRHDDWREQHFGILFSHSTGRPRTDLEVFKQITAHAVRIDQAGEAPAAIDRALQIASRRMRPVYLEVPHDLWTAPCSPPGDALDVALEPAGSEEELAAKIAERLASAKRPAVLLGVEVARYGLQDLVEQFVHDTAMPWATTLLAKSVLSEQTAGFAGVYDSDLAPKPVRTVVEQADVLLALGCVFGVDHTQLVEQRFENIIHVEDGWVRFGAETPERGQLRPLVEALLRQRTVTSRRVSGQEADVAPATSYADRRRWVAADATDSAELSYEQLFEVISRHLSADWLVIADTCLGSYPAADLEVKGRDAFIGNPVWLSIGHSVGAAVGAAAGSQRRPVIICGDGGLQTTVQGLSTLARCGKNPLVIVIDNGIYAIEQYLLDPKYFQESQHPPLPYVGLNRWQYTKLAESVGFRHAQAVGTVQELEAVLAEAVTWQAAGLISARIDPRSLPPENQP